MIDPNRIDSPVEEAAQKAVASEKEREANSDPLTGAPGAHPIGTGAGAAGGATAGAAVGTAFAGPIGFVAGGIAGAVIGGLAGKGAAEAVNPTDEDAFWRDNYKSRPYVRPDSTYNALRPAYKYGWESHALAEGRDWDALAEDLRKNWEKDNGQSTLPWAEAGPAVRDAWERVNKR
jgi:phage tail tape-measure protein